jgi:hypothetical protein
MVNNDNITIKIMRSDFENMDSSYDEAAIWALFQQKIDGWNAGNGNTIAAPYTEVSLL